MKQIFKIVWVILCLLLSLIFLLSACSQFIPPAAFCYIVFIALAFPYLFLAVLLAAITSLFIQKKLACTLFILLIAGLYNLFHVVAVSPLSTWKQEKEKDALRIMTWNVEDFINAMPLSSPKASARKQILEMMTSYQPDVMCLQEYIDVEKSRDLVSVRKELDSLGYKYIFQSDDMITKTFYGTILTGVAICSKTPFLDTGRLQVRFDWRPENMLYADVMLQNKKLRISTGHLYSFYLFPDSAQGYTGERTVFKKLYHYRKDVKQKMCDVEMYHQQEAMLIRNHLDKSPYPNIYCGDMNAVPTSYTYHALRGNMQDAFLKEGNGIGATFYNIVPTLRIDVCFADKAFDILQCQVARKKISDHYAVVTDVKWRQ